MQALPKARPDEEMESGWQRGRQAGNGEAKQRTHAGRGGEHAHGGRPAPGPLCRGLVSTESPKPVESV